jgi:hypothetical protein
MDADFKNDGKGLLRAAASSWIEQHWNKPFSPMNAPRRAGPGGMTNLRAVAHEVWVVVDKRGSNTSPKQMVNG